MTKNPTEGEIAALLAHELLPVRKDLEIRESEVEVHKMNEIAKLIRLPESLPESEKNTRIARALDLYESLAPSDGLEGMLAVQMVGTHHAVLECLRLAAVPEQTFAGRDMNLKHAQKLMVLYTQQLAALNKHRGKGQQKVTVEHVNVQAGGQAIVGNVETGQSGRSKKQTPPEIEHAPDVPMANVKSKGKVAGKRKK